MIFSNNLFTSLLQHFENLEDPQKDYLNDIPSKFIIHSSSG